MRKFRPFLFGLLFGLLGFSISATAQQTADLPFDPTTLEFETPRWQASIVEIRSALHPGIPFIEWDERSLEVEDRDTIQWIALQGKLSRGALQVTLNGKPIPFDSDGKLKILLGFTGKTKRFILNVFDQNRISFRGEYEIRPIPEIPPPLFKAPRFRRSLGVGYTFITYEQTDVEKFTQNTTTVKGGITYFLVPDQWDLGFSGFYNASVISSSNPDYRIQYLGLNARLAYRLIKAPNQTLVNINTGIYYNTTLSNDLGFKNVYGPQAYPEVIHNFKNKTSLFGYAKFSPILLGSKVRITNREVAAGLHYSFPIARTRGSVGIDYSNLSLTLDDTQAKTSTFSLSFGLSF